MLPLSCDCPRLNIDPGHLDSAPSVSTNVSCATSYANYSTSFYASALFTKLPILLYYLRVLARASSRLIKWILIGTIAFVVVYSICIFFGYGFNCNPVEASWLSYDLLWTQNHTFKCGNVAAISMFAAVMNCVTNYWMLGLTIFFVRGLNLAKKEKIVLGIFIGLGFMLVVLCPNSVRVV